MPPFIHHLIGAAEWAQARRAPLYAPPSLAAEGFVHCSTADQLLATATRHLPGRRDLLVLTIRVDRLTSALRWEESHQDGERFPHVYGPLDLDAVVAVHPLEADAAGAYTRPPPLAGPLAGTRVRYLFLEARDLEVLVEFYATTLGLSVTSREPGHFAFLRPHPARDFELALYRGEGPGGTSPHWFLALDVDDLEAAVAGLRALGVPVEDPHPVPFGRAAFLADPEGNRIELHEPARGP